MAFLLPYLPNLTTFAHIVYRFFYCVFDCTFVNPMCNSVLFVSHCFALSWLNKVEINKIEMVVRSGVHSPTKNSQNGTNPKLRLCMQNSARICSVPQEKGNQWRTNTILNTFNHSFHSLIHTTHIYLILLIFKLYYKLFFSTFLL